MGDLNAASHPAHRLYAGGYPDCFTALGLESPPTSPSMPTCGRLPNEAAPSQTLDEIVSNRHARVVAAQALQFYFGDMAPSDHWPVLAVYEIEPGSPPRGRQAGTR